MDKYLQEHQEEYKRWLVDNEQGRVEIKILPYLQDIENGFFVEAGALDGLFMSNTKILEDLGWDGILIEPSHKAVEKCRANRKCIVEECALVSKDYEGSTISGDFFFEGGGGLGAWSSVNRKHYGADRISVTARTLDSILKQHGVNKVDFLSLDVEGYELEVLRGIDFDTTDITFILAEVNNKQYSLEDMEKLLSGYTNLGCLSKFSVETNPGWDGSHQDYLFKKI